MQEHTYQLTVELQVHSARTDPKDVETKWHALLSQLIEVGDDCALVSAIKCAKVHTPPTQKQSFEAELDALQVRYLRALGLRVIKEE